MPFKSIPRYLLFFSLLTLFLKSYSQNNSAWLQRSWNGKAFILNNGPQDNYNLVLTISKIKGKTFEGTLRTIQPSDTTVQFTTKVDGFIYEKHMQINIGTWKVNCGNCKPQTLAFSIENGKFYLKGEAKGCSQECTWITVFSKDLIDFDVKTQDDLFAAAEEIINEPDTSAVAENIPPPIEEKKPEPEVAPRTVILPAGAIVATGKHMKYTPQNIAANQFKRTNSLRVNDAIPERRIPVIAAGDVVSVEKNNAAGTGKLSPSINKNAGLKINDAVPDIRTPLIAAGEVSAVKRNDLTKAGKIPTSLNGKPDFIVNTEIPDRRIPVIAAGGIVAAKNNVDLAASQVPAFNKSSTMKINDAPPEKRITPVEGGTVATGKKNQPDLPGNPATDINKYTSLKINDAIPDKRIPILAAGGIAATSKKSISTAPSATINASQNQPSLSIDKTTRVKPPIVPTDTVAKAAPVKKDTAAALPEGYANRKKNVVKTIDVNTDSITLRIYDNGIVDGDIVSVVYNDKVVVDKLSLIARALVIKLPVNKEGVNKLVFHAHNLGEFPPNTAQLEVLYGSKKEELTISSDYTISSALDIIYQGKP